jgi:hypothetical protein
MEEDGGGAKSYDVKKAWFSISNVILSGLIRSTGTVEAAVDSNVRYRAWY